ncbi:hypothetical protein J2Z29_001730 [Treponema pedis]|uniref:Uncharacterized protein n=1 Tax=Treponema pedis str. T A4 TaxID=1291379 RepID=S5ZTS9_9SPIR|nr:hypothetical protein TPE_1049 [Treponema pedis str. T A4]
MQPAHFRHGIKYANDVNNFGIRRNSKPVTDLHYSENSA